MNANETKEIVRLICAAYPTQRQRMNDADLRAMLEVWCLGLADLEFEVAKAAAGRIVCTSKWLPSIAEFRAEVGELHHGTRRTGLDAWGDVRKLLSYRESTEGLDPLVLQVCDRFGWIEYRVLWRGGRDVEQWHVAPGDNEESDRIRFAQLYDSLARDERKQAQLTPGAKISALKSGGGAREIGAIVGGLLPERTP